MQKFKNRRRTNLADAAIKNSFRAFCQRGFKTATGDRLSADPYVDLVCAFLEPAASKKGGRMILNLPPRHAKTALATVCLAAWVLARDPKQRVMLVCYGDGLAQDIAYQVRKTIRARWFQRIFECRIADDRSRVSDFATTQGGQFFAASIDGPIQGRGADLIIVDDANRVDKSLSPDQLERVRNLFDNVVAARLNSPRSGRIVIVGHRTHADDLSGHLLQQGGWRHLALPFKAEEATSYRFDGQVWRRRPGELLRPEAFSARDVQRILSDPQFDTLYQQLSYPPKWRIDQDDFGTFSGPRQDAARVLSIDTATGQTDRHSQSVIQVWHGAADCHRLIDEWVARVGYADLCRSVFRFVKIHRPSVVLIEDTHVGQALIADVRARFSARVRVEGISPGGRSKIDRLKDVIDLIKGGLVCLPEAASWKQGFIDAVTQFPHASTDDELDAMTQYLAWARRNPSLPKPQKPTLGVIGNLRGYNIIVSSGEKHYQSSSRLRGARLPRKNWIKD